MRNGACLSAMPEATSATSPLTSRCPAKLTYPHYGGFITIPHPGTTTTPHDYVIIHFEKRPVHAKEGCIRSGDFEGSFSSLTEVVCALCWFSSLSITCSRITSTSDRHSFRVTFCLVMDTMARFTSLFPLATLRTPKSKVHQVLHCLRCVVAKTALLNI